MMLITSNNVYAADLHDTITSYHFRFYLFPRGLTTFDEREKVPDEDLPATLRRLARLEEKRLLYIYPEDASPTSSPRTRPLERYLRQK